MDARGDAPAVVHDGDGVVRVDGHVDGVAEAGHGLVDGVVDDLIDQVVQPADVRGADVHARPAAHRLQTLQHLNLRSVVFLLVFHTGTFLSEKARGLTDQIASMAESWLRRSRVVEVMGEA